MKLSAPLFLASCVYAHTTPSGLALVEHHQNVSMLAVAPNVRNKIQGSVLGLKDVLGSIQALTSFKKTAESSGSSVDISPEAKLVAKKYATSIVQLSTNLTTIQKVDATQPVVVKALHEDEGQESCDEEEEEMKGGWFSRKKKKIANKKSAMVTGLLVKVFTALKKSGFVNCIIQMSLADEQTRENIAKLTVLLIEKSDTMLLKTFVAMKKTGFAKSIIRFMMLDEEVRAGMVALMQEMTPMMIELGDLCPEDLERWKQGQCDLEESCLAIKDHLAEEAQEECEESENKDKHHENDESSEECSECSESKNDEEFHEAAALSMLSVLTLLTVRSVSMHMLTATMLS